MINQLNFENIDNSDLGIHCVKSAENLESIMEWETPFKGFDEESVACLPPFNSFSLGLIESELDRSAKEHHKDNTHRHLLGIISIPI